MNEFAGAQWDRAQADLALAVESAARYPEASASRAYYAAFHAVSAVMALRGESFKKRSAVRGALHRDLINAAGWPADLGQAYDALMV